MTAYHEEPMFDLLPGGRVALASPHSGAIATYTTEQVTEILRTNVNLQAVMAERAIVAFINDDEASYRFVWDKQRLNAMSNGDRASLLIAMEQARQEMYALHLALAGRAPAPQP